MHTDGRTDGQTYSHGTANGRFFYTLANTLKTNCKKCEQRGFGLMQ